MFWLHLGGVSVDVFKFDGIELYSGIRLLKCFAVLQRKRG